MKTPFVKNKEMVIPNVINDVIKAATYDSTW